MFEKLSIPDLDISPCRECPACKETGECVIRDDTLSVFTKLLQADKIVISSPNFFYGFPAQFKALIDRCQAFWVRKHILELAPELPDNRETGGGKPKEAFALLLGATGGDDLFTGQLKTIHYFLEPLNARLVGSLLFRKIEERGDISRHPDALAQAFRAGRKFNGQSAVGSGQ